MTRIERTVPLLVLVRHGECIKNIENTLFGQLDIPLEERGRKQMVRVARLLGELIKEVRLHGGDIQHVLSSDLSRCHESARIIVQTLKDELDIDLDVELTQDLREYHLGQWENVSYDEVKDQVLKFIHEYKQSPLIASPPGEEAESHLDVAERVFPHVLPLNLLASESPILEKIQRVRERALSWHTFLKSAEDLDTQLALNLWVVHEGSGRSIMRLLNADITEEFRYQNVEGEFLEDEHQTFFQRGDIIILGPVKDYQKLPGYGRLEDELGQAHDCHIRWRILYHHKELHLSEES